MIRLTNKLQPSADDSICVRRFPFLIGRGDSADFRSNEQGVWDEHFQLDHDPGNGIILTAIRPARTLVNNVEVVEPVILPNSAVISAGALRLQFNIADVDVHSYRHKELLTWAVLLVISAFQLWLLLSLPH